MTDSLLPPIGTIVTISDPRCVGLYRVKGHGPKNALLQPCHSDGTDRSGRGARMPGYMLHPYDPATAIVSSAGVPMPPPPPPGFDPGVLVTVPGKPGVFVVIADKGTRINVAQLGGAGGGYWRIPPAGLTVISLGDLTSYL